MPRRRGPAGNLDLPKDCSKHLFCYLHIHIMLLKKILFGLDGYVRYLKKKYFFLHEFSVHTVGTYYFVLWAIKDFF